MAQAISGWKEPRGTPAVHGPRAQWGTEKSHDSIPTELVDGSLVPMDLVHEETKTPVHNLVHRLWIEVFEHGRGIGNIGEEDSD